MKNSSELIALADELREYTALRYAGDCKCGKCQLVPREIIIKTMDALRLASVRDRLTELLATVPLPPVNDGAVRVERDWSDPCDDPNCKSRACREDALKRASQCEDELNGCRETLRKATIKNATNEAKIADLNDMVLRYAYRAQKVSAPPEASPAMVAAGIEACNGRLHARTIRKVYAAMAAKVPATGIKPGPSEPSPGAGDEEKELFAAVTKFDLAGAIKHLRNWAAYKANEHCQEYADLIEAQAKLIAWFVKERTAGVEPKSQEPDAVEFGPDDWPARALGREDKIGAAQSSDGGQEEADEARRGTAALPLPADADPKHWPSREDPVQVDRLALSVPFNPCLAKLRKGEPFFVLLGRDKQAPLAVAAWADARERAEGKTAWTDQAREVASSMADYSGAEHPKPEPRPDAVAWDTPPIDLPKGLHPKTANLVRRFANALAKKLRLAEERYGYGEEWAKSEWEDDCREHLYEHLEKGDPRDVAAYCAFMWHHGWITAHPTTKPEAQAVSVDAESIHQLIYKDTHNALEGLVPDTFLSGELWIATQKAATAISALAGGR